MNSLFSSVGGKIKNLAKTMFVFESVASIIAGVVLMINSTQTLGIGMTILLFGPLAELVLAWFIYGFGEIVEHAYYCNQGGSVSYKPMPAPVPKPVTQAPVQHPAASPVQKAAPAAAPVVEKKPQVQPVTWTAAEIAAGYWLCECGAKNKTLMCMDCGQPKK